MKKLVFCLSLVVAMAACKKDDSAIIDERDQFIGAYATIEQCPNDTLNLQHNIVKLEGTNDEVRIQGDYIYGLNYTFRGIVSGNRLTLPSQTYYLRTEPELSYTFDGTGLMAGGEMRLEYNVTFREVLPIGIDERYLGKCKMIMTKQ